MTSKRAAILQILRESEGHLTAEEIFARAKTRFPGMAFATVYNNLHALEEAGAVLRIRTVEGPDVYDKTPTPHDHALCTACGRVIDVDTGDMLSEFSARTGLRVQSYDLLLHVLCADCAANAPK